ncbi:MAG: PEP/pyruvate-binding domain-containing protein [Deltaproteobacteria bacterium]|jgi:pyruvate,water dikinase
MRRWAWCLLLCACGGETTEAPAKVWDCVASEADPAFLQQIGCDTDFDALASAPLDATIPGARSTKTVLDRVDGGLYFSNSARYPIHFDFVSAHLSGEGRPIVPMLADFNATEYSAPSRRFLLGAVTYYAGPDVYVYELAPYDAASAEMIVEAFTAIEASTYFGDRLRFLATSASIEATVAPVAERLRLITIDELFAGIDYQPLNPAEAYGRLRFITSEELQTQYVSFRDVVVLDNVPNDISVVSGIVTEQFQTPLSHINVLSKNRGTPNMALRGAYDDEALRALDGAWVRIEVTPTAYTIEAVSVDVADAWWAMNKPAAVQVPGLDGDTTGLVDIEDVTDLSGDLSLFDAVKAATRTFGGKAAHFSAMTNIDGLPYPPGFAVPVSYYLDFMDTHGFTARVEALLADDDFNADPALRDAALASVREDMMAAPLDAGFEAALVAKLEAEFAGTRMRFRSSTNAEDLDGFTGAGLYTSKSGDPNDPERPVADAVREVWASVWLFRAFEERSYRSIDHLSVAMALLVHRSFPDEEANGVALTNNPFDPSGLDPAFYVNVQRGDISVVQPPPGITADAFLYYFDRADQPQTYVSRSNITVGGASVLTRAQTYQLGEALDRIRSFFFSAYGEGEAWWAMDVEFKFDGEPGEEPALYVKQARPYQ